MALVPLTPLELVGSRVRIIVGGEVTELRVRPSESVAKVQPGGPPVVGYGKQESIEFGVAREAVPELDLARRIAACTSP